MAAILLVLVVFGAIAAGFIAKAYLLYLIWSTLVVPFTGWPGLSFAAIVALVLFYDAAFRLKSTETAKQRREDRRTQDERSIDALKDVGNAFGLLAFAYVVYGVAYVVMR